MAPRIVLEPIFEADFLPVSFGFRPRRSATDAKEVLRRSFIAGHPFIFEADIRDYFGKIDHDRLLSLVAERVSDRRVIKLIRKWLRAGVMDEGEFWRSMAGTPRGGVISPLLSNIYLHALDEAFADGAHGTLVRCADDVVVACRSEAEAREAQRLAGEVLAGSGLELQPEKTGLVDLREGREGFDFVGCHFHARVSGRLLERGVRRYYLQRWPSKRAMSRILSEDQSSDWPKPCWAGHSRCDHRDQIRFCAGGATTFAPGMLPRSSSKPTAMSSTVFVV